MRSGRLKHHRLDVDVVSLPYRRLIIKENRIDAEFAFNCPNPTNPLVSKEMDRRNSLQFQKGKGKGERAQIHRPQAHIWCNYITLMHINQPFVLTLP